MTINSSSIADLQNTEAKRDGHSMLFEPGAEAFEECLETGKKPKLSRGYKFPRQANATAD
jgi:hypothetical protein